MGQKDLQKIWIISVLDKELNCLFFFRSCTFTGETFYQYLSLGKQGDRAREEKMIYSVKTVEENKDSEKDYGTVWLEVIIIIV